MDTHNLIAMANRIGQFFESFSDRAEALAGISNHIRKFWEPRMRRALVAQLDEPTGQNLLPIVSEAVRTHRDQLV